MRKKILLLLIVLSTAMAGAFAISWRPIAEMGNGLTLTHNIAGEDDSLYASYYLEASIVPLDITIADTLLGIYASFLINGESSCKNHLSLLGYKSAEIGMRAEYQFTPLYSLFLQTGTGYGVLNSSKSGFAQVSGAVGSRFAVFDLLSFTIRYMLTYRSGLLDHRAGVAVTITPMGSIKETLR